jgi:tetratricopeptide (TPR) repeat protein
VIQFWLKSHRRFFRRLCLVLAVSLLLAAVLGLWWIHGGLARGTRLLQEERYFEARTALKRYLWLRPGDASAILKLAEAFAQDPDLPAMESSKEAVSLLQQVEPDSPFADRARLQEARLRFLILNQPTQAERLLRGILDNSSDSFTANYLLWKILDLTRRYHLAEPYFRGCFGSAEAHRHEELLIEWYFSQFSTFAAASHLDELMGFAEGGRPSDTVVEYRRLMGFVEAEPESSLNHAVLADWYHARGMELEKWASFERAWKIADQTTSPSAYAIFFDLLHEAGRFDEAKQVMKSWPEPRTGYDFWKRETLYYTEIENNPETAIAACRKAIQEWPGPVDWQVHHRLAGLLMRIGKMQEAEEVRNEGKRLEKLMEVDFHKDLRQPLFEMPAPVRYEKMAQFYSEIGRELEATGWQRLLSRPRSSIPPGGF